MGSSALTPLPASLVDDPNAPELYASNVSGIHLLSGNVIITLESARADHASAAGTVHRVVVGRVVLPAPTAQHLAAMLQQLLERNGLVAERPVTGLPTRQ